MPRKISKTEPDRLLIRQALQEGTVLSALSVYELDEVIDFMQVVTFTAGQTCDLSGALCVVVEGTVSINPEITENSITASSADSYAAGQVFGQVGLFHDKAPEMAVEGGGTVGRRGAPDGPGVPVVGRRGCGWAVRAATPWTSTPPLRGSSRVAAPSDGGVP